MGSYIIKCCSSEHIQEYGEIYAKAFSGEPWNDCWKIDDAILHVSEILESKQSYGLERCLAEMEERGIKGVNLITANEGILPGFYGKHGFEREDGVILMGRKIE